MSSHVIEARAALGKKVCAAFLSNGYKTAVYAPFAADASRIIAEMVPDGASVGIPGSLTVRQLGLIEKFAEKNCAVYHHWDPGLAPEMKAGRLKDELNADWFVTSSNAITYDGKIVNIDGVGNRVAGMAWATGKIVYVVSINKSEPNVESAIARSRNVATPPNALRIDTYPPCTKIGYCVDCNSPDRACRAILIIEKVPVGREAHVVLVGENLGY